LVHCAAGISRSVCLVVAYLIKVHKMTPEAALAKIREKRPWAGPN
jgi:protein-tyrosine phosphatase